MPWRLSGEAARAVGSQPRYDGGGPWNPAGCAPAKTPEALALERQIRSTFPWVNIVGGRRCEQLQAPSGPQLSIHAVGRALDVMVPTLGGDEGEALANWLVANAGPLGVQLVIWNGAVWQGSLGRQTIYTGSNPHTDHVHVEVLRGGGSGGLLVGGGNELSTPAAIGLGVLIVVGAAGVSLGTAWLIRRARRRR